MLDQEPRQVAADEQLRANKAEPTSTAAKGKGKNGKGQGKKGKEGKGKQGKNAEPGRRANLEQPLKTDNL